LKKLLLATFYLSICFLSAHAQQNTPNPCAEIKDMFDQAVYRLDSLMGSNIKLHKQADTLKRDITKTQTELKNLEKTSLETKSQLGSAKELILEQDKLIRDQNAEIKRLEAELKRLSKKSSG